MTGPHFLQRRYGKEIRERVLATYDQGNLNQRQTADQEGVAVSALRYWLGVRRKRQLKETGFVQVNPIDPTQSLRCAVRVMGVDVQFETLPAAAYLGELIRMLAC
jgi:transposase-like protein